MRGVLLVSEARAFGGAELYLERLADFFGGWKPHFAVPDRPAHAAWRSRLRDKGYALVEYAAGLRGLASLVSAGRSSSVDLLHINLPSTYDGMQGILSGCGSSTPETSNAK